MAAGCKCSPYQLEQVGCECELVKVDVWPNGYADDRGLQTIVITVHATPQTEAVKEFGFTAKVSGVRRYQYVAPVSQAAATAYTHRDNT